MKTYVVFGAGRSGLAVAKWMQTQKEKVKVYVWDDNPLQRQAAEAQGFCVAYPPSWKEVEALIQSPGIPWRGEKAPQLTQTAQENKVPIISDISFYRQAYPKAQFVGITGTNGKSTTTALVGHILKNAGKDVAIGGNLGTPIFQMQAETLVLELSSFQLDLSGPLDCEVVGWLNISPDHLDIHGDLSSYIEAKKRIFAYQKKPPKVVIGIDDPESQAVYEELGDYPVIPVSVERPLVGGIYVQGGYLIDHRTEKVTPVLELEALESLRGSHNHQNTAVAYGMAVSLGIPPEMICQALRSFQGLVHRQERVGCLGGIQFINDSKATNGNSALQALRAFEEIYWIAGGRMKEPSFDQLIPFLGKVRHAFFIGEAQDKLAEMFYRGAGRQAMCVPTLPEAVRLAYHQAVLDQCEKGVVLLSPACASYDQFRHFEHRGEVFRQAVQDLISLRLNKE